MESERDRQFSNDDVRRILERATKIEKVDGSSISESELRAIAAEAQIDAVALTRAIAETTGSYSPKSGNVAVGSTSRFRSVASAGVGGLLTGSLMAVLGTSIMAGHFDFIGLGLIAVGVFRAALAANGEGWHRELQLKNALMWGGYAGGWALVIPSVGLPALMVSSACAAVCAAVGAGIKKSGLTPRGLVRKVADLVMPARASTSSDDRAEHDRPNLRVMDVTAAAQTVLAIGAARISTTFERPS